jgi:hypothetical protein
MLPKAGSLQSITEDVIMLKIQSRSFNDPTDFYSYTFLGYLQIEACAVFAPNSLISPSLHSFTLRSFLNYQRFVRIEAQFLRSRQTIHDYMDILYLLTIVTSQ